MVNCSFSAMERAIMSWDKSCNFRHNRLISPNGLERLIASDFSALKNCFQEKYTHAGSLLNTTLPACYIYDILRSSRIPSEPLVRLVLLVLLSLTARPVLGSSSPSLIPATGFAFASGLANPPGLYTLHFTRKNRIVLAHMRFFYYLCGAIYSIVFTIRTTITILPATMEHKSCPRCGATFICQHENPAKCQCASVVLSPATRAHLAAQYPNQCLCRKCLLEFSV